jgi:6-phosphofructokinase
MTISEGAHFEQGIALESGEADAYGHKKLGGIGHEVAQQIKQRTGINIIYQQLAYIMRSGAPDSLDRMVAVSYGNLALDQVAMGHTGRMVALQQGIYTTVPLDLVVAAKKQVDISSPVRSRELPTKGKRHARQTHVFVLMVAELAHIYAERCGYSVREPSFRLKFEYA